MSEPSFQEAYQAALSQLNSEQLKAVQSIEGPVMVVAGPGTGKTQILAARVAYILQETDTEAQSILCLTYTEAGTVAMRKRLFSFIGSDAYLVHISTFHAFCNELIQSNLELFEIRNLALLGPLEEQELLRELIDKMGYPLKRKGASYYEAERLPRLFQIIKREAWDVPQILRAIDAYIQSLPQREEFIYKRSSTKHGYQKGDIKLKDLKAAESKMELLKQAFMSFEVYEDLLAKKNRFTFDDMVKWVVAAFKDHPSLLSEYQERFQYILVDEYQDTNGSQNKIIQLLSDYWDNPNVFVVGDDDQSIFKFQGANLENILDFNHHYSAQFVTLLKNYRSTQAILDASKALIRLNQESLEKKGVGIDKELEAKHPDRLKDKLQPKILEFENTAQETIWIADEIGRLKAEGVSLSEIAVIYPKHKGVDELVLFLQRKSIPLNIKRKSNLLHEPFIINLLDVITYLDAESHEEGGLENDGMLFRILHYPQFKIPHRALANIAFDMRAKKLSKTSWRNILAKPEAYLKNGLFDNNLEVQEQMRQASNKIEMLLEGIPEWNIEQLFVEAFNIGSLEYAMNSPKRNDLLAAVAAFFRWLKEEKQRDHGMDLGGLLKRIDLLNEGGLAIEFYRSESQREGVNFTTAHSSKGLEFEYVFMPGCDKSAWTKNKKPATGYSIPEEVLEKEEDQPIEEYRRLFFVAMTRAKRGLNISFANANLEGKVGEQSQFVSELVEHSGLEIESLQVDEEKIHEFESLFFRLLESPKVPLVDKNRLAKRLETYSLSASHLNNYLKCPLSFYFENFMGLPGASSPPMAYGSAVHEALEVYFEEMTKIGEWPDASYCLSRFKSKMLKQKYVFTERGFQNYWDRGLDFLPKYLEHYKPTWNRKVRLEAWVKGTVEDVPINGKIDKIEEGETALVVVDYKTGSFANARKNKRYNAPKEGVDPESAGHYEIYGGDSWRQGVFYKLLLDSSQSQRMPVSYAVFDHVEPDEKTGEFHKQDIEIRAEDLQVVREQIRETYRAIQNFEFDEGCGEEDCRWCSFVDSNFGELGLDELDEEPMETFVLPGED